MADYIGTWTDPLGRDSDFIINKDLIISLGRRNGNCEKIKQTNNILLLRCSGKFGVKEGLADADSQYVRLQIFYYPDSRTEASQRLNITLHFDIDCARAGRVGKECFFDGAYMNKKFGLAYINKNYDMYER